MMDDTGQPAVDPNEAPVQAPVSPERAPAQASADQTVNVFNRFNEPENVSQSALPQYLQAGYRVASPAEIAQVKNEQTYGGKKY